MPEDSPSQSHLTLYQTEDNRTRIEVRLEGDTVWLTQANLAELYQTTPQNITLHIEAIYAEGELAEEATCKDYLQVRREGSREVRRALKHYNLEMVLALRLAWKREWKNFNSSRRAADALRAPEQPNKNTKKLCLNILQANRPRRNFSSRPEITNSRSLTHRKRHPRAETP